MLVQHHSYLTRQFVLELWEISITAPTKRQDMSSVCLKQKNDHLKNTISHLLSLTHTQPWEQASLLTPKKASDTNGNFADQHELTGADDRNKAKKTKSLLLWWCSFEWQNDYWHIMINKAILSTEDCHDTERARVMRLYHVNECSTNAGALVHYIWPSASQKTSETNRIKAIDYQTCHHSNQHIIYSKHSNTTLRTYFPTNCW